MCCALVCVIKVSVPVAEVVGVEEGRVEILPQKSVEDTDKDFTGGRLSDITNPRLRSALK